MGAVLSPAVENLVAQLTRLPGVGQRTAQRLAFHLLQVSKDEALALASALEEVKERVRFCRECGNLTEEELCGICVDARRDHALICVVEQPVDLVSLERTHEYRGLYHVLGGALSPLDGVEPEHLRIDELLRRVDRNGVQEVVLATNPNMTGEATAAYLADRLRGRVRVTRLASGLPVGGDLEYADEVTLGRALTGAHTSLQCAQCHTNNNYSLTSAACVNCHLTNYNATATPNHTAAGFPTGSYSTNSSRS